ncbi:hypothetical protein [Actinomadura fibrosa]|uniref:DUF1877 family protein n=1 Tax=Actinomadura fibrosa TaxID=111802 RepID=A0ABW2XX16_9ACTN|nr:hypothetical protein [Actinomadura fibrosa]
MGYDIAVFIADWAYLEGVPAERRAEVIGNVPYLDDDQAYFDLGVGWWPPTRDAEWAAVYEFRYSKFGRHWGLGDAWEAIRDHAEPGLRDAMDEFLMGLVWEGPEGEAVHVDAGLVPDEGLNREIVREPGTVAALARAWERAAPGFDALAEPFDRYAAPRGGWVDDWGQFAGTVRGWAEVVTRADRLGWGVIALGE